MGQTNVCEVAFHEWTSEGKLRALAFLGLREDKTPTDVVREHFGGTAKVSFFRVSQSDLK